MMIRSETIRLLGQAAAVAPLLLFGIAGRGAVASSPPASDVRSPSAWEGEGGSPPSLPLRVLADETANWDINFRNFTVDLSADSTDEILFQFDVGKDQVHSAALLAKGCEDSVTGVELNATDPVQVAKDDDHDALSLGYSLDKSSIVGSNIWNSSANALEFCHVLKLILPANETLDQPLYEIGSDVREVTVDVNLTADFSFTQGLITDEAIRMLILGWVNFTAFAQGGLANSTVEQAIAAHASTATGAMGQGQEVHSVEIRTFVVAEGGSNYYYGLVLQEPCYTACEDLLNSTTMYENVTGGMKDAFDDGSFLSTFKELLPERRELSAPAAAPDEGSAIEVPPGRRRLQDGVTGDFESKPLSGVYANGWKFVEVVDEEIQFSSTTADVGDYIQACRCGGAQSFACDTSGTPLSPNDELNVCVYSTSTDVVLASLENMVVTQGTTNLDLIKENQIIIPEITEREYVSFLTGNGVAVTTRVPSNIFTFSAGGSLTVSGLVLTALAGSSGRRELRSARGAAPGGAGDGRDLQAAADERAPFELEVTLVGEGGSPSVVTLSNSAAVVKKGFVAMGAVLGAIYNLLW